MRRTLSPLMRRWPSTAPALFLVVFGAGCFASHGLGGEPPPEGERCGPVTCAEGQSCCNESCGICAWPGEGCISLFCADAGPDVDAGPGGVVCGGDRCAPGAACCMGCDGPYCGGSDGSCADVVCLPDFCLDNNDCADSEYCFFAEGTCGGEGDCRPRPVGCRGNPVVVCGCDGAVYENECEAARQGVSVAPRRFCGFEPPMGPCDSLSYCECTEQPGCEPLVDLTPGCICTCDEPFNCSGDECDCDCGGAEFYACALEGLCDETEVTCGEDELVTLDPDGCLRCQRDP